MAALLQDVTATLACLRAVSSSVGSGMNSTLSIFTTLLLTSVPRNSLKCYLFALLYFQMALSVLNTAP